MIEKIVYRVNRSSDVEITAHLLRADATFEPALCSRVDIPTYAKKLRDRAVRFEAWQGDEIVGLVASYCNELDGGKAFVTSVSVWPECQRQGIAGRLMHQCIEHIRGLGFVEIGLEVNQRSLPAVEFYKMLGFNTMVSDGSRLTMNLKLGR